MASDRFARRHRHYRQSEAESAAAGRSTSAISSRKSRKRCCARPARRARSAARAIVRRADQVEGTRQIAARSPPGVDPAGTSLIDSPLVRHTQRSSEPAGPVELVVEPELLSCAAPLASVSCELPTTCSDLERDGDMQYIFDYIRLNQSLECDANAILYVLGLATNSN